MCHHIMSIEERTVSLNNKVFGYSINFFPIPILIYHVETQAEYLIKEIVIFPLIISKLSSLDVTYINHTRLFSTISRIHVLEMRIILDTLLCKTTVFSGTEIKAYLLLRVRSYYHELEIQNPKTRTHKDIK